MENQESYPIHAFVKNHDEEIRLNVRKYKDRYFIDLRIWFRSKDGEVYKPTKNGVFFPFEQFPELKKGVERMAKAVEKFRVPDEVEA